MPFEPSIAAGRRQLAGLLKRISPLAKLFEYYIRSFCIGSMGMHKLAASS